MHVFSDYIQPLTAWLYANPNWALIITFLISLAESLAIIGSIVPGSVTMTAIGILAGSGVMRIDLTLAAAITGAIAGDVASYALGYTFSDRLTKIWPFSHYPKWLEYGNDYFTRHGGKSVLIGRFVGPLRSIIPVIAGMMRMPRWHFFLANSVSAIGWGILYLMPGVLIGAASSELSAESATRLFSVIIMVLIIAWVAGIAVKWLFMYINKWLHLHVYSIWIWSKRHPRIAGLFKALSPAHKKNYYPTITLVVLLILFFIASIILTLLVIQNRWISGINTPISLFLHSLRTPAFDTFFIAMSFLISPVSLLGLFLTIAITAGYYKHWRLLRYWLSIGLVCGLIVGSLTLQVHLPNPITLLKKPITATFPAINLTVATALFCFLMAYISARYQAIVALGFRMVLVFILAIAALSTLYLGDNWLTSVLGAFCIGLTIGLLHWIFFRRQDVANKPPRLAVLLSCLVLIPTSGVECLWHYKQLIHNHSTDAKQHVLTHEAWWHQNEPLLPLYTTNRIGKRIGLFNVQYVGSLKRFEQALTMHGWEKQTGSLFHALLLRAGGEKTARELPLMAPLYLNLKPSLVMYYHIDNTPGLYIIRLWASNYHLDDSLQPIWIGSLIHSVARVKEKARMNEPLAFHQATLFAAILPALHDFTYTRMPLPTEHVTGLSTRAPSELLIIKAPTE